MNLKISIAGTVFSFTGLILLLIYFKGLVEGEYSGFLPNYSQERLLIEFIWMILTLALVFFMSYLCWYCILYILCKKLQINHDGFKKEIIYKFMCSKCRFNASNDNLEVKCNQKIKFLKLNHVKGYFCKESYRVHLFLSNSLIVVIPGVYNFAVLYLPNFLAIIGLSYLPGSFYYLSLTTFPVLIITILIFVLHGIYVKITTSKKFETEVVGMVK